MHVDLRDVRHAGQQVPLHVRIDHLAGVAIENPILEHGEVERADDAAIDLAFRREPAHDEAAILQREDAHNFHDTGLDVDLHLGELGA